MSTETITQNIRQQFRCLSTPVNGKRLAYLDSASTALKPDCVVQAISDYYLHYPANIHRGVHAMSEMATARYEQSRESVRQFINAASTSEIVFTGGTTDGINLAAVSIGEKWLEAGDEVLITGLEHHANIVPWQLLRQRRGIKLNVVPMTSDGDVLPETFRAHLTPRTRLVAFTALSNAIGTVPPIAELIRIAHETGAKVLIDAAQAIASMPIDVQKLDCDFLVFSGHKLFGPTGIGVLYGKKNLLEAMPPYKGGGDMIRSVTLEETTYNDLPFKFEAGTANIAGAIGLGRAIEFVNEIGFKAIMKHEDRLVKATLQELSTLDAISIIGRPRQRRNIISFVMDGIHPHDIGTLLDEDGIAVRAGHHCAQPLMHHFGVPATVRASFSIYNTEEDVAQFITSLKRIIKVFA